MWKSVIFVGKSFVGLSSKIHNVNQNFQDILSDGGEILIDSLLKDSIIKDIPILGTSLKLIRGLQGLRELFYLNKVKRFIENIGEIDEHKRKKLLKNPEKIRKGE